MDTLSPLRQAARLVAKDYAAPHADAVDQQARFPAEAITALKREKLLSAYIPAELGGGGVGLTELVDIVEILARECAATAMIFAMHQIQVISIVRHAMHSDWYRNYLRELVAHQYLIASVTSEVGVGGEMRRSNCAVDISGERFTLIKDATTISYGAQADDLLVTARRNPDAANSDQSLILVRKADYTLEQKGGWDTMGMRGTCSPPFLMCSTGDVAQIIDVPFGDMSAQTVVPVSHLLWGGCWMGCAAAAVNKARAFVRGQARANPGTVPPTALRLAELVSMMQSLRTSVQACLTEYEALSVADDAAIGTLTSMGYSLKMNNLKIDATQALPQIVTKALSICGILGYKNDSKFSMSRHLRDAHSAAIMVGNDRILATNANLLLVLKDD
ncbi:acyl-CoA/acyl-ACP dehydrogenase [Undibacterium sp. CY18W]|uniref:Acyl-CoA/acyl-ACP dehydrogenase n=1 Tax=Undibacterium hunanense TaxID=2762292 RepID=A0ABR6ZRU1_9BURK|nr:acyl-CoA dehydrogenase family protein [Undibacterium hunanense]MBC3918572.1 acyl-CoA/acyl-ACP dehydrogenase [Undibacterium hunanense]